MFNYKKLLTAILLNILTVAPLFAQTISTVTSSDVMYNTSNLATEDYEYYTFEYTADEDTTFKFATLASTADTYLYIFPKTSFDAAQMRESSTYRNSITGLQFNDDTPKNTIESAFSNVTVTGCGDNEYKIFFCSYLSYNMTADTTYTILVLEYSSSYDFNSLTYVSSNAVIGTSHETSPLLNSDTNALIESRIELVTRFNEEVSTTINSRMDFLKTSKKNTEPSEIQASLRIENKDLSNFMVKNKADINKAKNEISINDFNVNEKNYEFTSNFLTTISSYDSEPSISFIQSINPYFITSVDEIDYWVGGKISSGKIDSKVNVSEREIRSDLLTFGADTALSDNLYVGTAISYGMSDINIGTSNSGIESKNTSLSFYGMFSLDSNYDLKASLGYYDFDIDSVRAINAQTLTGMSEAEQIGLSITIDNDRAICNEWCISNYSRLDLSQSKFKPFTETGGNNALSVNKQRYNGATAYIGTNLIYKNKVYKDLFKPFFKFEYGYDLAKASRTTMMYSSGSTTEYTYEPDKDSNGSLMINFGGEIYNADSYVGKVNFEHKKLINNGEYNSLSLIMSLPISEFLDSFQ